MPFYATCCGKLDIKRNLRTFMASLIHLYPMLCPCTVHRFRLLPNKDAFPYRIPDLLRLAHAVPIFHSDGKLRRMKSSKSRFDQAPGPCRHIGRACPIEETLHDINLGKQERKAGGYSHQGPQICKTCP
jgi:hypothetical protein